MNTSLIISNLVNHLSKFNHNDYGISPILLKSFNHIEQGDESALFTIILEENHPASLEEDDAYQELLLTAGNYLMGLHPNLLISDPEDSETLDAFSEEPIHATGLRKLYTSAQDDTYLIQASDSTYYITIIQSGQY